MILPNYVLNQGKNYISQKLSLKSNFPTPKPSNLILFLTYRCNLRCRYCQGKRHLNKNKELKIEDLKNIIQEFKEWVGPYHLTLTGGEPFQKKSIIPLIKYLQDKGIRINILTNGISLNRRVCKEIINSKIDAITISLNSLKPDIHDYLSRKKGSCQMVKSNIKLLKKMDKKNRLQVYIATIINKINIEELPSLVEYAKKMNLSGIKFQAINFCTLNNKRYDAEGYKKTHLWPQDKRKIEEIINTLINMKKYYPIWNSKKQLKMMEYFLKNPEGNKYRCMASRMNLCVSPYGCLGFCELKNNLSHLADFSLKEFWYSETAERTRREKCDKTCKYLNSNSDKGFIEKIVFRN